MKKETRLSFSQGDDYDNKIDIEVRLTQHMSKADYAMVVDAANTILAYAGKYLPAAKPEAKPKAKA